MGMRTEGQEDTASVFFVYFNREERGRGNGLFCLQLVSFLGRVQVYLGTAPLYFRDPLVHSVFGYYSLFLASGLGQIYRYEKHFTQRGSATLAL